MHSHEEIGLRLPVRAKAAQSLNPAITAHQHTFRSVIITTRLRLPVK